MIGGEKSHIKQKSTQTCEQQTATDRNGKSGDMPKRQLQKTGTLQVMVERNMQTNGLRGWKLLRGLKRTKKVPCKRAVVKKTASALAGSAFWLVFSQTTDHIDCCSPIDLISGRARHNANRRGKENGLVERRTTVGRPGAFAYHRHSTLQQNATKTHLDVGGEEG